MATASFPPTACAGPDVSYDADPNTGFAVYGVAGFGGWAQVGGTSDAPPQWAALTAIADQGRALLGETPLDGFTQTLPALYALPSSDFHDITTGSNGNSAGPGFDLATGRGTPIANLVVQGLLSVAGTPGTAPTITTAAAVTGSTATTATLHVAAAEPTGHQPLMYTWTVVSGPATAVSFSPNDTTTGSTTTATFTSAGSYTLEVTATDPTTGLFATSQVSFTLTPTVGKITVSPSSTNVAEGGTYQFSATATDQFGNLLVQQPAFTWSLSSSSTAGTINSSTGAFQAGSTGGTYTVYAKAGSPTVTGMPQSPSVSNVPPGITTAANVKSSTATTVSLNVAASEAAGDQPLQYTWTVTSGSASAVTFSPNGTTAANNTTATFTSAGSYTVKVTVTDPSNGLTNTSTVSFAVAPVFTKIGVSPSSVIVAPATTQQFTAAALDQFGNALSQQPAFTWSLGTSSQGSISTSGLYTAAASGVFWLWLKLPA